MSCYKPLCFTCGEKQPVRFWSGVTICENCGGELSSKEKPKVPPTATFKSRDTSFLKTLPNPGGPIETRIDIPEFTMLGAKGQADFGILRLWFYPGESIVELKSLKFYIHQYRDILVSYERVVDCIYDDLMSVYAPQRLRIEAAFRPRGGISSTIVIDSDWGVRGGTDEAWRSERHTDLAYE